MATYIEKSALVAEIQARIGSVEISQKAGMIKKRDAAKEIFLFKRVLSLIETLEVKEVVVDLGDPKGDKSALSVIDTQTLEAKEVDLDEEIEKCMKRHHMLAVGNKDFTDIAYHFFILGKKQAEEQMMANAIDVEVKVDAGGYPYIPPIEIYDYNKDITLAKKGDKYKVVLIKEDNYE